jgi:hypothetical protein
MMQQLPGTEYTQDSVIWLLIHPAAAAAVRAHLIASSMFSKAMIVSVGRPSSDTARKL